MNEREHESLRINLGAYALGALGAAEAAAVEGHLTGCSTCRAELDELRPAAAVLGELRAITASRVDPAELDLPGAPPELGARIDADLAAHRRRAWWRRGALAAVAGAAAAAVLIAGIALTRDDDPAERAAPQVPMESVEVDVSTPGIEADAALVNHTWGVEVKLTGTGFRDGGRYRVVVLAEDGRRFPAGEFVGTGGAELRCNLNSSVLRPGAAGFEVRDPRGRLVVSSTFGAA